MTIETANGNQRERFLLTLFPAAIVLAIYSVVFALPLQRTKATLEAEYVQLNATSVSNESAELASELLASEREGLDRLKKKVADSRQQIREQSQSWRSRASRLETLEKISELMRDHNLTIVSQGSEEIATLTNYLRNLFQIVDRQFPDDPVQFWQVKVQGTYFEVSNFLHAVSSSAKQIIPIGITMVSDPSGGTRKNWTISFAI